jgi:excisionase family DNA binding protein
LEAVPRSPFLSIAQVAEFLAVDHKTVRRLVAAGTLPALRVGRVFRIDPADLAILARRAEELRRPARRPAGPATQAEFARRAREMGTVLKDAASSQGDTG